MAATNRTLSQLVKEGRFREDLFFRLNVVRLVLPPLRERVDDIPLLLAHYLKIFAEENGLAAPTIEAGALRTLQAYPWPGNVRELRNFFENAVVLRSGGSLTEYDLGAQVFPGRRPSRPRRSDAASAPGQPALGPRENERRLLHAKEP